MSYVPKFLSNRKVLTTVPEDVSGFVRRYLEQKRELNNLRGTKARVILKLVMSWTLIQAETELGEVRFRQIVRTIGLSMRSPTLRLHRLRANNFIRFMKIADWLPDSDAVLPLLATLDDQTLAEVVQELRHHSAISASDLKKTIAAVGKKTGEPRGEPP